MCSGSWSSKKLSSSFAVFRQHKQQQQQQKKKQKSHVSMTLRRKRLRLRRTEIMRISDGAEMEVVNLKLYLENRCILAENERLREKASALRRENLALRADLCKTAAALPVAAAPAASSC
ncbi:hypothetical protein ABZP36_033709 [Zizania latifolia]